MRTGRYTLVLLVTALATILSMSFSVQLAHAVPWVPGHVFAAISNGQIQHYDGAGNLLETLDCGFGGFTTGMAFNAAGDLYVTEFSNTHITVFDGFGDPHTILQRIDTGTTGALDSESILFDAAGNFYVGHPDGNADVLKYDAAGNFLDNFDVALEFRGSDWIDLAADQTTLYYTSEGHKIMRYDLSTKTQLTDFAVGLPGSNAYALRLLPGGGALVADTETIVRLDGAGNQVQSYDATGEDYWFALNLDPDGTSFWSGGVNSGKFYKFDIATGTQLMSVDTGAGGGVLWGLVVYKEITVSQVIPEVPLGTIMSATAMIIALVAYVAIPRLRKQ